MKKKVNFVHMGKFLFLESTAASPTNFNKWVYTALTQRRTASQIHPKFSIILLKRRFRIFGSTTCSADAAFGLIMRAVMKV